MWPRCSSMSTTERRRAELDHCGRYFANLERRDREARERERRQWLEALTRGWRRPF